MIKLRIIVLLLLAQCACEKNEEMIINPYILFTGGDTTADGRQVFGIIGDSNADGRGETIPVVSAETLYNSSGSTITEITTQSVANDDNTKGSIWQQFATVYKSLTSFKTVIVNGAKGGAEFYPNGDNDNWYTSGDLYSAWKTKMDNTLVILGLSSPKAIFLNLGINDARSANSLSNIYTGIDSLISRLTTDYPNVPILSIIPGRSETTAFNDQRYYDLRVYLINKAESTDDLHIVTSAGFFIDGGYQVDNLHYTQATNNLIGGQFGKWFIYSDISNKWARSVVSSHRDTLNTNRKNLLDDFITAQYNNGNYQKMESLTLFKTSSENNILHDFTFKGYNIKVNAIAFTANDNIASNGSSTGMSLGYRNAIYTAGGSGQNDFILGLKLKTRTTPSATAGVMIGRFDAAGDVIRIAQSATSVNYHGNVAAAGQRNYTDAALQNNTLYSVARNGGNQYLLKGSSVVDTHALASSGACDDSITIGMNNNNGALSFYFAGSYEYVFAAKYSDFDLSSFVTGIEYVMAHWND